MVPALLRGDKVQSALQGGAEGFKGLRHAGSSI